MNNAYSHNDMSNHIFKFIYNEALRDTVMQKAFSGEKAWIKELNMPKELLKTHIDKILNNGFTDPEKYDKDFLETANSICKEIGNGFSFGNAQKLINMTVKHFYSICYYDPCLRENFRYCHCPLDSIIIKKVWRMYKDGFGTKARKDKLKGYDFFLAAWGKEGEGEALTEKFPERYKIFQQAVKDLIGDGDLYPIEFDYENWQ